MPRSAKGVVGVRHRVLLVACALAAATALPVEAAPRPNIEDPVGDAVTGNGAHDIASVTYAVIDNALVVTMQLAAAPSSQVGTVYGTEARVAGCGYWNYTYTPGGLATEGDLFAECGSDTPNERGGYAAFLPVRITVEGTRISWSLPTKELPRAVKTGSAFSRLIAFSGVTEPVLGSAAGLAGNLDDAAGKGSWRLP